MGCYFNLVIQVRYGQMWVNIINFGVRTPSGGYPLRAAPTSLFECKEIDGKYHSGEPEALTIDEVFIAMGLEPKKLNHEDNCLASYVVDYKREKKSFTHYLHYSIDESKLLVRWIPRHDRDYDRDCYKRMMAPVPMWMEMARTAYPYFKLIWMPDEQEEIDKVTQYILYSQRLLAGTYKDLLVKTMRGNPYRIPDDLVRYIAEFVSLGGDDVRLAWSDEEGHWKLVG